MAVDRIDSESPLKPPVVGSGEPGIDTQKFLSFITEGGVYAVSISRIKEIIEYEIVTRVPLVPNYIRGVINLRGSVVPVIDLSARLGKRCSEVGKRSCIIIIEVSYEGESIDLGLSVDAVNEVFDIKGDAIEKAPAFGASIREDFINAMGRMDDGFVILLDIDTVLSIDELSELGEFLSSS